MIALNVILKQSAVRLSNVVVLLLTMSVGSYAQSDNLQMLKSVLPPSPNSTALGKYADWPVNLYSGLPSISIPLSELKGRSLSVPVSLSYHASGNRVSDIASSVGLGWVLNAGGVISRTVRGFPDEVTNGFFQFRTRYTDQNNLTSPVGSGYNTDQNRANVAAGLYDAEPDIYSINALGVSYKLLFKGDGTIKTVPFSKVRVKMNWSTDTWTITLEDGTVLVFGGGSGFVERTQNDAADIAQYTSSWMLKSMTSPVGEVITFTYSPATGISQTASFSEKDRVMNSYSNPGGNGTVSCKCPLQDPTGDVGLGTMLQDQILQGQMLSTIDSETARIDFSIGSSRQDLYGGKNYTGIKVWSKIKLAYVEEYQFNYAYSDAVSGNTFSTNVSYWLKRLRLNSVYKMDIVLNVPIQKWTFEYDPQNLPSRTSYAQDHWGYFNGALGNTTSLPRVYSSLAVYNGFMPGDFAAGDREPHGNYTQAEMLKKITYPTGGYSKFVYESNSYPAYEEQFTDASPPLSILATPVSNPFELSKSMTFTTTVPQVIHVSIDGQIIGLADVQTIQLGGTIKNSSGAQVGAFGIAAPVGNRPNNFSGSSGGYINLKIPGTYTFEIHSTSLQQSDFHGSDYLSLIATLNYKQSQGFQNINKVTGGLRIASIEDYDLISAAPMKRTFTYESPRVMHVFDPSIEYVTTLSQQVPIEMVDIQTGVTFCDMSNSACFQDYLVRSSVSNTSYLGQIIGYGKVTMNYGASAENGKTVSFFTNIADQGSGMTDFPFPPPDSRDWQRGLLLMQTDYDAAGNKIKRVRNTYTTDNAFTITTFKAARNVFWAQFPFADYYGVSGTTIGVFAMTTANNKQLTSTQVAYSGTDSLEIVTNYYYDNSNNLRPTRSETTDSKGNLTKTISRTALEKTDINSVATLSGTASIAIDTMVIKNMISQVIQTEKWVGSNITSRSTTNFKVWYTAPTVVMPENVLLQVGNNTPETRVQFSNYDAKGNLRQQSKTNDAIKSYVYDYTFTYPIAEATNADFGSIAYTSFESDGAGNWAISSTVTNSSNAWTGKKSFTLTGNTVSNSTLNSSNSYVISLWAKSSSGITINSTAVTAGITRNGWTYYEKTVSGVTSVTIAGTGYVDEVRLYPVGAMMTTYTYDPLVGQTSMTDAANNTTIYEYDGFNRLVTIRDDRGMLLKTYKYNFQQQ
jgi:YD repeat-containing protein